MCPYSRVVYCDWPSKRHPSRILPQSGCITHARSFIIMNKQFENKSTTTIAQMDIFISTTHPPFSDAFSTWKLQNLEFLVGTIYSVHFQRKCDIFVCCRLSVTIRGNNRIWICQKVIIASGHLIPSLECQRTWDEWQYRTQFWEDAQFKSWNQLLQRRKGITYHRAPQFWRTNFYQLVWNQNCVG